jgi:hypothetical protein
MLEPIIQILGIYKHKLDPTDELTEEAIQIKYGV